MGRLCFVTGIASSKVAGQKPRYEVKYIRAITEKNGIAVLAICHRELGRWESLYLDRMTLRDARSKEGAVPGTAAAELIMF